jgi:hypothetical protein
VNRRKLYAVAGLLAAALGLTACSTYSDNPDEVGLYYLQGSSDGNKFDQCIDPGKTGPQEWNNKVVWIPVNQRSWNVSPNDGADSKTPTIVSTKPEPGQPSGVQVSVWSNTSFYLNTFCDKDGGVISVWWEKFGRRYAADTPEGWRAMLNATLVPSLNKATQDVVREYGSDELVGNIGGIRAEAQKKISVRFTEELKRLTGGDFFCGPLFNRASPECPAIEMILVDVDFADAGIQEARNAKQKAVELGAAKLATAQAEAAALLAEAKGKADAAAQLAKLYKDPNWVRLQETILKTQALIKACELAKECKLIVGADGNLIMS